MNNYPTYKLGEICELLNGYAFKSSNYVPKGLRVIRITNVKKGYVIDEEPQFYPIETQEELKKYILKKDDLLISLTGNVGRVGVLGEELLPAALNQRVGCLRVKDSNIVLLQYLYHLLNTNSFEKDCINSSRGIAQKNMSTEWLKECEIKLPPLPTQHQIVSRIETLFAELDKAEERLRTAQQQLKTYKQAVLNHWLNNEEGKWKTVKLGEVAEIKRGRSKHRPRNDQSLFGGKYPFIQTGEIREANGGTITTFSQTYSEKGLEQSRLWPKGTLCLTIAANIAETAYLGFDACFPDSVVGILAQEDKLNLEYFNFFIQLIKQEIENKASATAQKNINVEFLENLGISLPPLSEQQRIVNEIESRLSQASTSSACIEEALQQTEALRQSILKKAFSGELV